MARLRQLTILGVYRVEPTAEELDEALEVQWGAGLAGDELQEARRHVLEHFEGLYLIEVQLEPPDAAVDWARVGQPDPTQPESNWQVAYDEQPVRPADGRWAFFLHFVDFGRPLMTPVGPKVLPSATTGPRHLANVKYEFP